MVFSDPYKIDIPVWARYIGLALFLKGFEDKGYLVTRGIYSKIRNPMYVGFILWIIGFPIFMQAFTALASGMIWIPCFIYWKMLEEKELEEKYEEYKEYKKRTWF